MSADYEKYVSSLSRISDVGYAAGVLNWDQEVYMPEKGGDMRAQQVSTLAGISHEMATTKELGELLKKLSDDNTLNEIQKINVKKSLKDYTDRTKFSTEFVELMSRTVSASFQAWQQAKKENNYKLFSPLLKKLVELKKQECEIYGYKEHPYDALLDMHEPGMTTKTLEELFTNVRSQLVGFIKQITAAKQNRNDFMFMHYNKDKQWGFGIDLLKQMGFDFEAGRQDISSHPFTINFGALDVRVTTRISENDFYEMTTSCIHEGGHALYEQGLLPENYGLPAGEPISLGIHESQSRLWENNVGRGLPFWKCNYKKLLHLFPENLANVNVISFFKAMNLVEPSLIRTNADELTYHSHVMIRFEIEKALIENKIDVDDLPAYWNSKYKEYLGVDVPDDAHGVLQDIHWSHGSFGYFPTYSLGSFYAAQFYAQAKKDIKDLEAHIQKGDMKPLLTWLRENIHRHGRTLTSAELCVKLTGEPLNFEYFMRYAREKYSFIYGIKME